MRKRWKAGLGPGSLAWISVMALSLTEAPTLEAGRAAAPSSAGPKLGASSIARVDGKLQGPELAFDGDLSTGWQTAEGSNGEWIDIELSPPRLITSLTLFGGRFSSPTSFAEHNRLAGAEVVVTHRGGVERLPVSVPDAFAPVTIEIGREVKKLRVVLGPAYSGSIYADTSIAELAFNLDQKDAALTSALETWKRSRPGETQLTAYRARLEEAIAAAQTGELGGFSLIADAARRGLEPLRVQAQKLAGPGLALSLLDPEPSALEALKKIGTPEAADALEQARYLLDEGERPAVARAAAMLRAGVELKQPRRNLPRWGTSGWEAGALRGRREPLALALDPDEYVFVADTGNNRLQRFDPDGRFERSSGSAATLEERFFGQEVAPYVAGHRSGDKPGQLTQPISLAWKKEWGKETLLVLDTTLRIQLFDRDFRLQGGAQLSYPEQPTPGLGLGNPQVLWLEGKPAVAWKNDIKVFDLKGKVKKTIHFERPVRTLAVAGKTLWVHHGGLSLQPYTLNGQKQGVPLALPAEDAFEDIDLTSDSRGTLYGLSDQGILYTVDGKGKLGTPRRLLDEPTPPLRLAVGKERIFITGGDKIQVFSLTGAARAEPKGDTSDAPPGE